MYPKKNDASTMKRLTVDSRHDMNDNELMSRVADGDHAAFDTLYRRHARKLGGFFLRMLAYDTERSNDMLQELFTAVWTHRAGFREGHSFTTWVYTLAYNMCRNAYRHEQVRKAYETECLGRGVPCMHAGEELERNEMKERLRRVVQELPSTQRDIFLLHYDEELTVSEVAKITGCPEGTVKSRLYSALETVRKRMKNYK